MSILLSVFISLLAPVLILIGDWICNVCAKNIGMDVGIEGHEWEVEDDEEMKATQNKHLVIDVSDNDDEIAPVQKKNDSRGKSWRLLRVM